MSDKNMVMFPRELGDDLAELIAHRARVCGGGALEIWEAICEGFGKPAEQRQGELVGMYKGEPVYASAESSAPSDPDQLTDLATWKRRAIEAESKLRTYDLQVVELGERAMQALLADPKPSEVVLMKCKLCDQLQADLTERDELIDQLRSGFVFETGPYQVEMTEEQWAAALDVFENYNMGDEQHFVFLEDQGRGVISEILIAIGVARAPDADEVVE